MSQRLALSATASALGVAAALIGFYLAHLLATILTVLFLAGVELPAEMGSAPTLSATVAVYSYALAAGAAVLVFGRPRLGAVLMLISATAGLWITKSLAPYAVFSLALARPGSNTPLGVAATDPSPLEITLLAGQFLLPAILLAVAALLGFRAARAPVWQDVADTRARTTDVASARSSFDGRAGGRRMLPERRRQNSLVPVEWRIGQRRVTAEPVKRALAQNRRTSVEGAR